MVASRQTALACLTLAALGCGAANKQGNAPQDVSRPPEELIVGQWERVSPVERKAHSQEVIRFHAEFKEDGTLKTYIGNFSAFLEGTYRFINDRTIETEIPSFENVERGLREPEIKQLAVVVSKEELILTDAGGNATKYRRWASLVRP